MSKNLIIVESPAKAKTIEGYLGTDYTVKSCYGHVRDLPKGDKAIDIKNNFKPTYEVTEDKRDVVKELRALAKKSDTVWLATDDDREGEAISWHLLEALDLDDAQTPRIVFREITKTAILKAIDNPRRINHNLVNAQQARRVLDRLVGFELSPILWKKIKTGLSAGRVQSVAVRLIVDREREIDEFLSKSYFKTIGRFAGESGKTFTAELIKKIDAPEKARNFLQYVTGASYAVSSVEKRPTKRTPAPPFTTSTLQQEASRKLSFSVAQTMQVAQKLYEAGKISYMRTDSLNLSEDAIIAAQQAVADIYGEEFSHTRRFKTKNESAQEAHEAIRPTDFRAMQVSGDRNETRLYDLIWKRAIASQMADARLEKTTVNITISPKAELAQFDNASAWHEAAFVAQGEVILFEGFMKVYVEDTDAEASDEEGQSILPPLRNGEVVKTNEITSRERFTRPPARYTEASLVKSLEEQGIGRPSTYAPTISTIQKREYVSKETRDGKLRAYVELRLSNNTIQEATKSENYGAEKSKLFPTDVGMVVNDFLVEHFEHVVDYGFTANVEKEFDLIAQGQSEWSQMIGRFYSDFHPLVEKTESIERSSIKSSRILGQHPETGQNITVRLGRFGPVAQLGDAEAGDKPAYASLRKDQRMDSLTLNEALELFKLPREVGIHNDIAIQANVGRFGPYLKFGSKFYSLPKDVAPQEVSIEEAIEIIRLKDEADANRLIKSFDENPECKVLNGRYGPYISFGSRNLKIPKDVVPLQLTYAQVLQYADEQPDTPKRGGKASKATPKVIKPTTVKKPKNAATGNKKASSAVSAMKAKPTVKKAAKAKPKK